jgi:two-component system nitrogen regulation sensor histidine kinase NtrY
VSQIAYMMKRLTIDKSNKKIDLDVNSREMHALVQSYNEMVDQIDNNVKELAKNQRELAWREMAKQVAHEIKNPLTPMKLSVQNFKLKFDPDDPQINSKLEDFSKTLVQQIDVLSSIATAFSSFAEFPDQKNEFIDFAEEIQLCLEIFNDHDIKFIKPKEKIQGNFDKSNLVRIVTNLVKNSIQATSELNNPNIEIELKKIDNNIELKISDNGSGIPTSLKEKIFEPNFTTKNKGTGLGLSIIKKLIDSYNGKIGFTSKAGKTIFKITVPTT